MKSFSRYLFVGIIGFALFLNGCDRDFFNRDRGVSHDPGRVCFRGDFSLSPDGDILADAPIDIVVYPRGCFSSSCTEVIKAECRLRPEFRRDGSPAFKISAEFRLRNIPAGTCTADCSGGGFGRCGLDGGLPEGDYEIRLPDSIQVNENELTEEGTIILTVPSKMFCIGDQF